MKNSNENELKLTITQDKLVDILMHAATRDDIAKLDAKSERLEDKMDARFDKIDARFIALEDKMDARFDKIDARFIELENKTDARFDKVDARFIGLENKMDARFTRLETKVDKIVWGIVVAILVPIAIQILPLFIKRI
jgi:hypothetical protein